MSIKANFDKKEKQIELPKHRFKYTSEPFLLAMICLILLVLFIKQHLAHNCPDNSNILISLAFISILALIVIYNALIYFKTYCIFDEKSIEYHTPFSNKIIETWDNLIHAKSDSSSLIIFFKNNKKIKLPHTLNGFNDVRKIVLNSLYDENTLDGAYTIIYECFELSKIRKDDLILDKSLLSFSDKKILKAAETLLSSDIEQQLQDYIDKLLIAIEN